MNMGSNQQREGRGANSTVSTVGGPAAWSAAMVLALSAGSTTALAWTAPEPTGGTTGSHSTASGKTMTGGGSAGANLNFGLDAPDTTATPGVPAKTALSRAEERRAEQAKARNEDSLVVDLHVQDEELANVLEMLSIQSQRNIVASKSVSARVTANLYGVTFFQALDAILHANGYGYVEKGNFIYIYTLEELQEIEATSRSRVSRLIRLNYLNATDAAEFVKPLLSDMGQIKTNGKTGNFPSLGETPVSADEFANEATLVVFDYEENVGEIQQMLKQLDTKPAQVLVESTILQTSLNEANAFGVDFSLIADLNFTDFMSGWGGPLQAVNALNNGRAVPGGTGNPLPLDNSARALSSTPGNTAGPSTLKIGIVENDVSVFLRMLDEVTDTTILSNPKILALNRMPARVLVGRKVGYISTTSTDTATTQTVQFLNTGTQLYFRPFVTTEGMIRMELKPQVSEAQIRDVKDANGAAVTIPDELTNELVTNVLVGDGQTIVLGGLFREQTQTTRRQVPFLGDIPVLGNAFRGTEDSTNRSEIIFLITPSIVNEQVLTNQGKRGVDAVERARTGARDGLLFWSREKLTGQMNLEADRLAQNGDKEKALWKLQQSLWLDPSQNDAIALRERLTGEAKPLPSRSMLDDVVRGEAVARYRKVSVDDALHSHSYAFDEVPSLKDTIEGEFMGGRSERGSTATAMSTDAPEAASGTSVAEAGTTESFSVPSMASANGTRFGGALRWAQYRTMTSSDTTAITNVVNEPMTETK
jgi:type IV pilus secretin PilQ/predicted competence protein